MGYPKPLFPLVTLVLRVRRMTEHLLVQKTETVPLEYGRRSKTLLPRPIEQSDVRPILESGKRQELFSC